MPDISGVDNIDPSTTKYLIRASLQADGVVEKPDVVGAIFGQTEGLLGNELDLRDLQKSGRIGRIEVDVDSKKGRAGGSITLPSSMDKVETAILAAALESIDRVGPCRAEIRVQAIEDVRVTKRKQVIDRAKTLLHQIIDSSKDDSADITEEVRQIVRTEEIVSYGADKCPAGPNVAKSDSILIVEGRNDVLNLLKIGIKNAIAVEGTNVPPTIQELTKSKVATAFLDGDRGGDLILKELLQTSEVDFVARAPRGQEVEELTQKAIMKCLRNKVPVEQYIEVYNIEGVKLPERSGSKPEVRREMFDFDVSGGEPEPAPTRGRERERGPGRERERDRQPRAERERPVREPMQAAREPVQAVTEDREGRYVSLLNELSGKLQAVLLDKDLRQIGDPIAVRDLADTLRKYTEPVSSVVFDGVITQRLLDIASEKSIATLVGVKTGNITKKPGNVEVVTRQELERA